ncbi:hypothetical protein CLTEP_28050 [Clostridium tepidiprofundi DSM 19306]|uniref:Uncharacterized protein n=1 Tax=Clostridium tepidiprofundi DSM 19306 TaxID=1121338 RepID=A0A151AE91_9CLOT|nr:hypothetical protein [Clostridium tepidiprofundi]KYH25961.1 hypothetical protein CLTEP_28050 [Clostridium tepidiprofundi DSM 19306]
MNNSLNSTKDKKSQIPEKNLEIISNTYIRKLLPEDSELIDIIIENVFKKYKKDDLLKSDGFKILEDIIDEEVDSIFTADVNDEALFKEVIATDVFCEILEKKKQDLKKYVIEEIVI